MRENEVEKKKALTEHQQSKATDGNGESGIGNTSKQTALKISPGPKVQASSPIIEVRGSKSWDVDAGVDWVHQRFKESKVERKAKEDMIRELSLKEKVSQDGI